MLLNDLPEDHIDRNISLGGCFYKKKDAKIWREVVPSYKIAKKTFNQLGEAWTNSEVFCWNLHEDN